MIKIISLKDIINQYTGELHFKKNEIYYCEITIEHIDQKYKEWYTVYKSTRDAWKYTYTHDNFYKHFIPLNEQRKLKIEKIRNS